MPLMRRGPGLIGTAARAGVAAGAAGRVRRRQEARWGADDYGAQGAAPMQQAQQAPPPPAEADYVAELQKLAGLRDSGVITAEDFEAKKKQLLGI